MLPRQPKTLTQGTSAGSEGGPQVAGEGLHGNMHRVGFGIDLYIACLRFSGLVRAHGHQEYCKDLIDVMDLNRRTLTALFLYLFRLRFVCLITI